MRRLLKGGVFIARKNNKISKIFFKKYINSVDNILHISYNQYRLVSLVIVNFKFKDSKSCNF